MSYTWRRRSKVDPISSHLLAAKQTPSWYQPFKTSRYNWLMYVKQPPRDRGSQTTELQRVAELGKSSFDFPMWWEYAGFWGPFFNWCRISSNYIDELISLDMYIYICIYLFFSPSTKMYLFNNSHVLKTLQKLLQKASQDNFHRIPHLREGSPRHCCGFSCFWGVFSYHMCHGPKWI